MAGVHVPGLLPSPVGAPVLSRREAHKYDGAAVAWARVS